MGEKRLREAIESFENLHYSVSFDTVRGLIRAFAAPDEDELKPGAGCGLKCGDEVRARAFPMWGDMMFQHMDGGWAMCFSKTLNRMGAFFPGSLESISASDDDELKLGDEVEIEGVELGPGSVMHFAGIFQSLAKCEIRDRALTERNLTGPIVYCKVDPSLLRKAKP